MVLTGFGFNEVEYDRGRRCGERGGTELRRAARRGPEPIR